MTGPPRITNPFLDVIEVFLTALSANTDLHGWAIMKATKRSGPTVYGVLDRLEDMGWITGEWEIQNPDPSKPRRRFYRLTPTGQAGAVELLRERRPQSLKRAAAKPGLGLPGWPGALPQGGMA
jgi:PadR family transcriptional regulator PadR